MSITTEIERLQAARNKLRTKGIELGITNGTAKLDEIAEAFDDIVDQGNISAEIKEGETYTIPAGYHSGSGTVTGIAGGGNYKLQSKIATPTKKQQSITPDAGNYGLSDVTIHPIPDMYQDVTPVTAGAGDVLATKVIVNALGQTVAGTMPNNGTYEPDEIPAGGSVTIPAGYHNGKGVAKAKDLASQTSATAKDYDLLNGETAWVNGTRIRGSMPNNDAYEPDAIAAGASITIPKGYHNGRGKIRAKDLASQTPATATARMIVDGATAWVNGELVTGELPEKMWAGGEKVLAAGESVTYGWGVYFNDMTVTAKDLASQTDGDATAGQILSGKIAWVDGVKVTGSMTDRGAQGLTIDGLTATSVAIPAGYHNGSGTVSLTGDIEAALAAV